MDADYPANGVPIPRRNTVTAETRANGIGAYNPARMQETIDEVVNGLSLTRKPAIVDIYDDRFLPPLDQRAIH